ncbi:MAG: Dabb family protein [Candidatus Dormibacteria bacterium]
MIRHLVLLQLRPECPPEAIAELAVRLRALREQIPELSAMQCGPDLGVLEEPFNFAISADFLDVPAYEAYARHPAHQRVIKELIAPWLVTRCRAQIDLSG